jgi:hypothetical protein
LAISGNAKSRVFSISPGATVTLSGLTIRNGRHRTGRESPYPRRSRWKRRRSAESRHSHDH